MSARIDNFIAGRVPGIGIPARGNAGLTAASGGDFAPSIPATAAGLPAATASDTATAIQTVADAYLAALGSQPANAGATVVVPTPPADGGSSMNAKTILVVAALAVAAWFLYKKFGPSAAAAS